MKFKIYEENGKQVIKRLVFPRFKLIIEDETNVTKLSNAIHTAIMKIYLTYTHAGSIFENGEFKPFIHKYFENAKFIGFECGYWYPTISITGMVGNLKIKDLPKSYQPDEVLTEKQYKQKYRL